MNKAEFLDLLMEHGLAESVALIVDDGSGEFIDALADANDADSVLAFASVDNLCFMKRDQIKANFETVWDHREGDWFAGRDERMKARRKYEPQT